MSKDMFFTVCHIDSVVAGSSLRSSILDLTALKFVHFLAVSLLNTKTSFMSSCTLVFT